MRKSRNVLRVTPHPGQPIRWQIDVQSVIPILPRIHTEAKKRQEIRQKIKNILEQLLNDPLSPGTSNKGLTYYIPFNKQYLF